MERLLWYIQVAALLVATLDMPAISLGALVLVLGIGVVSWLRRPVLNLAFAIRLVLLVVFVATYYLVLVAHDLMEARHAVKFGLGVVGLYATGYAFGRASADGSYPRALPGLLALAGGFTGYAFACVYATTASGRYMEIADRAVTSVWNPERVMNGPGLGAFASLSMCLLPLLWVRAGDDSVLGRYSLKALVAVAATMGFYTNLAVQNRTPVIAAMLAVTACVARVAFAGGARRLRSAMVVGVATVAVTAFAVHVGLANVGIDSLQDLTLFQRFQSEGLKTARYEAWQTMLTGMFLHPGGGRLVDLNGLLYAHNLWLDVAYDAGLLPLGILLVFQASHVPAIVRTLRAPLPLPLSLAIVALGVSFFATFAVEPTLAFSAVYFGASCFMLGVMARISDDLPNGAGGPSTPSN
jgi:hypothetical protein